MAVLLRRFLAASLFGVSCTGPELASTVHDGGEPPAPAPDPIHEVEQPLEPPPERLDVAAVTVDEGPPPPEPPYWPADMPWPIEGLGAPKISDGAAKGGVHVMWSGRGDAHLLDAWLAAMGEDAECDERVIGDRNWCRSKSRPPRWAAADRVVGGESELWVWVFPKGHRPPKIYSSRCVVPPQRRWFVAVERDDSSTSATEWEIGTHRSWDLDGDGFPEVLVPREQDRGLCNDEVTYDVFLMRGDCGHLIGSVTSQIGGEVHTAPFHQGVRELVSSVRGGRGKERHGWRFKTNRYRFDGSRLRKRVSTVEERCVHCRHAPRCRVVE